MSEDNIFSEGQADVLYDLLTEQKTVRSPKLLIKSKFLNACNAINPHFAEAKCARRGDCRNLLRYERLSRQANKPLHAAKCTIDLDARSASVTTTGINYCGPAAMRRKIFPLHPSIYKPYSTFCAIHIDTLSKYGNLYMYEKGTKVT